MHIKRIAICTFRLCQYFRRGSRQLNYRHTGEGRYPEGWMYEFDGVAGKPKLHTV